MRTSALRARVLLEEARALDLEVADLVAAADGAAVVPTTRELVEEIGPTFRPGTAATYRPDWRLAVALHGDRRPSDLGPSDLHAVSVAALRALDQRCAAAGLLSTNPAASLALDLLIIRLHLETGARRSGALALGPTDLDARRATIWFTERDSIREQPASPSLLAASRRHGDERPDEAGDGHGLLRRRHGRAVTGRDDDRLLARARAALPWAGRVPVPAHVLRHTALTASARSVATPSRRPSPGTQRPP